MNDRDRELDDLLRPLAELETSDLQLQRWQMAVRSEFAAHGMSDRSRPITRFAHLAAAMVIGFIVGGLAASYGVFDQFQPQRGARGFSQADATFERLHVKLE